MVITLITIL